MINKTKELTINDLDKRNKKVRVLEDKICFLYRTLYPTDYKRCTQFNNLLGAGLEDHFMFSIMFPITVVELINTRLKLYTPKYKLKYIFGKNLELLIDIKIDNTVSKHIKLPYQKILQVFLQDIIGNKLQKYIDRSYKRLIKQ